MLVQDYNFIEQSLLTNGYRPIYITRAVGNFKITDNIVPRDTVSDSYNSIYSGIYVYFSDGILIERNKFFWGGHGVSLAYSKNAVLRDNEFELQYAFYVEGQSSYTEYNSIVRKVRVYRYIKDASSIKSYNAKIFSTIYYTSWATTYSYLHGTNVFPAECIITKAHIENDDVVFTANYNYAEGASSFKVNIVNANVQLIKNNNNEGVAEFNSELREAWQEGSYITMENYNGSGFRKVYTHDGWFDDENTQLEFTPLTKETLQYYENDSVISEENQPFGFIVALEIMDADFYSGTHTLPTVEILDIGGAQSVAVAEARTGVQFLSVLATPTTGGDIKVRISFKSDSDNRKVKIHSIVPVPPKARSLSNLDYWTDGLPKRGLFSETLIATDLFKTNMGQDFGVGSFGETVKNIKLDARDASLNTQQ
jgi:parallel beta-helix repeat protein